jgi:hypothetical protein
MKPCWKPAPVLLALTMASATAPVLAQSLTPLLPTEGTPVSHWRFVGFPKSKASIPATRFE